MNINDESELHKRVWKLNLMAWGMVNCPLVMLTDSEENFQRIKESINDTFNEVLISYEGKTDFVDARPRRQ